MEWYSPGSFEYYRWGSGCRRVRFCSFSCQRKMWKEHRGQCQGVVFQRCWWSWLALHDQSTNHQLMEDSMLCTDWSWLVGWSCPMRWSNVQSLAISSIVKCPVPCHRMGYNPFLGQAHFRSLYCRKRSMVKYPASKTGVSLIIWLWE